MVKPDPREAVLGTANIWFSILLMNIPIIGWIVCICWAFSKRVNLNRRNLARATLIFLIIQIFIWWGIYSLVSVAVDIMMGGMQTAVNGINDTLSSITDISSMVEAAENGGIESIGNIADALQGAVDMLELLPF